MEVTTAADTIQDCERGDTSDNADFAAYLTQTGQIKQSEVGGLFEEEDQDKWRG
ncbi:uncharacterized protein EHS24_008309 [Apiotrichum porosum]|uniref:Uncharacterized protein n=1 Tax=Apiotrichum porosum TaxID=105984 RepID=A0A427XPW1_9TREE|nr:uncharacterized protein EHS24_008309 [Apiotrichum porosum]RSH80882.1 hypothetical protein EHS24_008309 [Apiotrichum porosum]